MDNFLDIFLAFLIATIVALSAWFFYMLSRWIYLEYGYEGMVLSLAILFIFGYVWSIAYEKLRY